jgi:hypothetical protein
MYFKNGSVLGGKTAINIFTFNENIALNMQIKLGFTTTEIFK